MDKAAHPSEGIESGQRRASEIAEMLAQAQAECRSSAEEVADPHGQRLFDKIAGYLDVAIQALHSYRQERPRPASRRTLH